MLATTIHKSNTTPHHQRRGDNTPPHPQAEKNGLVVSKPNSVFSSPPPARSLDPRPTRHVCCCTRTTPTTGDGPSNESLKSRTPAICGTALSLVVLLRKEVIQPHLPVRLPCYDLVLITNPTFDGSLLAVGPLASGVTDFHDLTGGVYKARERIHRSVADLRLLATPTSWGRVADPNPN